MQNVNKFRCSYHNHLYACILWYSPGASVGVNSTARFGGGKLWKKVFFGQVDNSVSIVIRSQNEWSLETYGMGFGKVYNLGGNIIRKGKTWISGL